jgi:L-cysteine desulfidase
MQTQLVSLLRAQVTPAFGCTEPVACALAVARAREALNITDPPDQIRIVCSPGIYKNGFGVGIPTEGVGEGGSAERGIPIAAALGALIGKSEQGLEVLSQVSARAVNQARTLVEQGKVEVTFDPVATGVFVQATLKYGADTAVSIISGSHTNITYVEKNGKPIYGSPQTETNSSDTSSKFISGLTLSQLAEFSKTVPVTEIEFLLEGARMNRQAAEAGLNNTVGHGVGRSLTAMLDEGVLRDDIATKARIYTAAAADARMGGFPIPIMSSAGSGNHGITAIIPVAIIWERLQLPQEKLARALALSHLVTIYIKEHTGKLSPICGCSIAAGSGAGAACTWLLGGDDVAIGRAIQNIIASQAGVFCDGGKNGCALKLAAAGAEAVLAAYHAIHGLSADTFDGIVGKTAEETIANLGYVSTHGMAATDAAILTVMQAKAQ